MDRLVICAIAAFVLFASSLLHAQENTENLGTPTGSSNANSQLDLHIEAFRSDSCFWPFASYEDAPKLLLTGSNQTYGDTVLAYDTDTAAQVACNISMYLEAWAKSVRQDKVDASDSTFKWSQQYSVSRYRDYDVDMLGSCGYAYKVTNTEESDAVFAGMQSFYPAVWTYEETKYVHWRGTIVTSIPQEIVDELFFDNTRASFKIAGVAYQLEYHGNAQTPPVYAWEIRKYQGGNNFYEETVDDDWPNVNWEKTGTIVITPSSPFAPDIVTGANLSPQVGGEWGDINCNNLFTNKDGWLRGMLQVCVSDNPNNPWEE